jgi:uncharacterized iron-regulated protein
MRLYSLITVYGLGALACSVFACSGVASSVDEGTSTRTTDLALRQLGDAAPHHRRLHRHGAHRQGHESAPPDDGASSPEPVDAGVAPPGEGALGDAAPPDLTPPDLTPPDLTPDAGLAPDPGPQELPRDIVAQSALPLHGLAGGQVLSEAELWDRLAQSPAVCLGETHNVPADHYAETRAIAELSKRAGAAGAALAVGFEMFQRQYQSTLGAFVAGQIDEAALLAGTEYAVRWGYDFSLYRPLLEAARDLALPALALNMRTEITRKIARTGLESLSESERAELPELILDDAEHREFIFGLFGVTPEHAAEFGLEDVYAAQTTWDETMAESAARWLGAAGAGARIVLLAGDAHCHESAIPRRLTRRTGLPTASVAIVLQSEIEAPDFSADGYDVLVVLEDSAAEPGRTP